MSEPTRKSIPDSFVTSRKRPGPPGGAAVVAQARAMTKPASVAGPTHAARALFTSDSFHEPRRGTREGRRDGSGTRRENGGGPRHPETSARPLHTARRPFRGT